jgi:hypothetical protein
MHNCSHAQILYGGFAILRQPRLDHPTHYPQRPEQGSVTALKEILQQGEQNIQTQK